jgi:Tc5 transposase DNA-binding domain
MFILDRRHPSRRLKATLVRTSATAKDTSGSAVRPRGMSSLTREAEENFGARGTTGLAEARTAGRRGSSPRTAAARCTSELPSDSPVDSGGTGGVTTRIVRPVKRRVALSDKHKVRLCQIAEDRPDLTQADIARRLFDETGLKVERSTVSRALIRSTFWLRCQLRNPSAKRHGRSRFPVVENALFELIRTASVRRSTRATLTDARLCDFAKHAAQEAGLSDFKASMSWLNAFKRRCLLRPDRPSTEPVVAYDIWPHELLASQTETLSNCDRLEDVYNLHATGLYYDTGPEDVDWMPSLREGEAVTPDVGNETQGPPRTLQDLINVEEEAILPSGIQLTDDIIPGSHQVNWLHNLNGTSAGLGGSTDGDTLGADVDDFGTRFSGIQHLLSNTSALPPLQAENLQVGSSNIPPHAIPVQAVPLPYNALGSSDGLRSGDMPSINRRPPAKKYVSVLLCVNGSSSHRVDPWIIGSTTITGPRDHQGRHLQMKI